MILPPAMAYLTTFSESPLPPLLGFALKVTTLDPSRTSSSKFTSGGVEDSSKVGTSCSFAK